MDNTYQPLHKHSDPIQTPIAAHTPLAHKEMMVDIVFLIEMNIKKYVVDADVDVAADDTKE